MGTKTQTDTTKDNNGNEGKCEVEGEVDLEE